MFVTGALSTLLPYALFFGMLLLFAMQSFGKQHPDTTNSPPAKVRFQLMDNSIKDQADTFNYYDFLEKNSFETVPEKTPRIKPPNEPAVSIVSIRKQLPIQYRSACMPLRAPPFLA